jgi:hypothetical protein
VEETTRQDARPEPAREPAFVTGIAYGVLAILGVALGVLGSFEFSWTAGDVPLAALGWTVVNLAAFRGAGWAMRGKLGAAVPAVLWLIVVLVLSSRRPEGDLVVTGTAAGYVFIFGGALAAAIAVALTPSVSTWMLGGAARAPGVRR